MIVHTMEKRWLILEGGTELFGYEEQMLCNNHPQGILPMEIVVEAGIKKYKYGISEVRSLAEMVEREKVTGKVLQSMLEGMFRIVVQAKAFLLQENNFYLSPETIFFSNKNQELLLVYYPGYQSELQEQLKKLSEWILDYLNITDAKAVYSGYALHVLCRDGDTGFDSILGIFRKEEYQNAGTSPWLMQENGMTSTEKEKEEAKDGTNRDTRETTEETGEKEYGDEGGKATGSIEQEDRNKNPAIHRITGIALEGVLLAAVAGVLFFLIR